MKIIACLVLLSASVVQPVIEKIGTIGGFEKSKNLSGDSSLVDGGTSDRENGRIRKIKDVIIYNDTLFHSAFPSVIRRPDGELLVAFRRAPERRMFGEGKTVHVDPNSYLMMVRSRDGEAWSQPELMYAHPFGGSQDPGLLQLRDGTLMCTSYGWALVRPDGLPNLKKPITLNTNEFVFLGGYLLRSFDGAKTWKGPIYPPHIEPEIRFDVFGRPLPAYSRGALYEGKDGRIFWVVAAGDRESPRKTSNHLLVSKDKGLTWDYSSPVAVDDSVSFNETSVYETPKGDIVAFMRTANFGGQSCIARSTDGGKSFRWQKMAFMGYPLHALRLPDNRVLLTYGHRSKPLGIRARVLNAECTDFDTAPETVLRADGGTSDLGYTWSTMIDKKRALVVYYYNIGNGTRHIAGSILEIN
jgi:sialidase-1